MRLGKIYYDLNLSTYRVDYKRFTFLFSSKFYIDKFKKELDNFVNIEDKKIYSKYRVVLECSEYLALSLYKKIEKRGFKVYFNNKEIKENESFSINPDIINYLK